MLISTKKEREKKGAQVESVDASTYKFPMLYKYSLQTFLQKGRKGHIPTVLTSDRGKKTVSVLAH